jgi:hypothetical protein
MDYLKGLSHANGKIGPLLGLFGSEDVQPGPAQVAELEAALKGARKDS